MSGWMNGKESVAHFFDLIFDLCYLFLACRLCFGFSEGGTCVT